MKNKNRSSLIQLLILTTVLLAVISMISTSNALSVNLQPGQSINDITQLALGFDNNAELNLAPGTYSHINDQNINTGTGNVTVRGTNSSQKSVIDLQGRNRFFTVNNGSTLKLENLIIKNCRINIFIDPTRQAGAIKIDGGELIINNCEFLNNTAERYGGVIYGAGPRITINNSIFRDNSAGHDGGALNLQSSSADIYNSRFFNNGAGMYGGAIYNPGGDLTISDCDFYNNSAGSHGGAVLYGGITGIYNCMFYNNTAGYYGGACSGGGYLVVNNSYFILNKASYGGGAIYAPENVDISFSKFYDNSAGFDLASGCGGAICGYHTTILNISFSDFIGNAAYYGGAIFRPGTLTMNMVFFLNNIAYSAGPDIYY